MKITKNTKGIIKEGYRYRYNGDLISDEGIEIDLDMGLFVTGSIEAGGSIKADEFIEAGGFIKAGDEYGISAGLYITCKGELSFGLNAYAGIKTWGEATEEEKTITCGKLVKGHIEYGILKETGIKEDSLVGKEVKVEVDGKSYTAVIKDAS